MTNKTISQVFEQAQALNVKAKKMHFSPSVNIDFIHSGGDLEITLYEILSDTPYNIERRWWSGFIKMEDESIEQAFAEAEHFLDDFHSTRLDALLKQKEEIIKQIAKERKKAR